MHIRTKLKLYHLKCSIRHWLLGGSGYIDSNKPRIWFFLGANYGNLGDVAITLSQEKLLKKIYGGYEVINIPISETLAAIPRVKKNIKPNDIVTLVGGGNISDLYEDIEFLRQTVIKSFPNNKIISFPQSVYFSHTPKGERESRMVQKIYSAHKDLLILMRDTVSFRRMKKILPCGNIQLAPDIVMTEDCRKDLPRNKRVLLCLRDDKEVNDTQSTNLDALVKELKNKGFDIFEYDTQIDDNLVRQEGGELHLKKYLDEVRTSTLVITNRLHGMIFAFITGTPAIVFDNATGKVSATYEWIKDCGYIYFADEKIDFDKLVFYDNFDSVSNQINNLFYDRLSGN